MVLLELTETELDVISKYMAAGYLNFPGDQFSRTENEKFVNALESVNKKFEEALRPKKDLVIDYKDLFHIKDLANGEYKRLPQNMRISDKEVEQVDYRYISLANALIMWLNGKNLLKRLAKFDFTDSSSEFEGIEE